MNLYPQREEGSRMFAERPKVNTLRAFEDFVESSIWQDIQREFQDWLDAVHIGLEDPMIGSEQLPSGVTDKELHRFGGNAETLRKALNVVNIIIEQLKQDKEGEEHDNR